jgi:hypothetical protein
MIEGMSQRKKKGATRKKMMDAEPVATCPHCGGMTTTNFAKEEGELMIP